MSEIFPENLVKWRDIARGVGSIVFHAVVDHHRFESRSDHPHVPHTEVSKDRMATIEQNYDANGSAVDEWQGTFEW